jgi:hypothetical protein
MIFARSLHGLRLGASVGSPRAARRGIMGPAISFHRRCLVTKAAAIDPALGQIATEVRGDLFIIAIDRPAKRNGFTPEMLTQLAEAYTAFENDQTCRCAVVRAEGDHFTGGLDLPKVAPPDAIRPR